MPDVPAEAVQAAAEAISRALFSGQPEYGTWMENDEALARAALEAAAPVIAAQERARLAAHLRAIPDDGHGPRTGVGQFIDRHPRLHQGTSVVAVLLAAADEIEHLETDHA